VADELGTVLGVWAHPDDETYLCGGLMARAVRAGSRVVCVTATRGELGSLDEQRWPPGPALAAVRTRELDAAMAALGVTEHHWLDYGDGSCADVPDDEAVTRIAEIVAEVRPDTVLTFGPDGMTGHSDHISVGRWTTAACRSAAPGALLAYATNSPQWLERFRPALDAVGAFMGAEPPCTPVEDMVIHEDFDGEVLAAKVAAIRAQVSQVEPLVAVMGEEYFREGMREESFRRGQ
jgi:LmbE family N-acetylglucosaminyl deacetylase